MSTLGGSQVRLRTESVHCPECGRDLAALEVEIITTVEEDALSAAEVRRIGTITCPECRAWFFHPLRVSSTAERSPGPQRPSG
jgi:uncharacterized protein with PIN domain